MDAIQDSEIRLRTPRLAWVAVFSFAVIAGAYLWSSRFLFLDDAFIHLRIAHNLVDVGFYSFNGDRPTFCTSSPLFTALLALGAQLSPADLLPKIVDTLIYGVLFVMIAYRVISARTAYAQWLSIAFLAAVASPLAMRWLADGMETGLSGVCALLLADAAFEIYSESTPVGAVKPIVYAIGGAALAMLRVEFCFLIAIIGIASLTSYRRSGLNALAISLAVGSAVGLGMVYAIFGGVLPDTAIAKAHLMADLSPLSAVLTTMLDIAKGHAASSSLGILVLAGGTFSCAAAIHRARNRPFVIALNASFALLTLLIIWRHQAIQGYRYFVFIEFFLYAFNIAVLNADSTRGEARATESPLWRRLRSPLVAALLGMMFVGWQVFDVYKLRTITEGRSASFEKFERLDVRDLEGSFGIAWDVGMIGYFSHATILDGNGLVNGPDIARMSKTERLRTFVTSHPIRFVFADEGQLAALKDFIDVNGWVTRETFDFPNFSGRPERHFLLIRPN